MGKKTKDDYEIVFFQNTNELRKWLTKNHSNSGGVWLRFFKKDSGFKSLNHDEALDEALCFGWIDGQAKKYDENSWLQKYTPRRKKSIWSKKNTDRTEELIKSGKMKKAGLKEVAAAKEDGRWEKAYDSPSKMTIPEDFLKKLSKDKKALKFFYSLNKTNKYSIVWRLQTAKKIETRENRMKKILHMLSNEEKFH